MKQPDSFIADLPDPQSMNQEEFDYLVRAYAEAILHSTLTPDLMPGLYWLH